MGPQHLLISCRLLLLSPKFNLSIYIYYWLWLVTIRWESEYSTMQHPTCMRANLNSIYKNSQLYHHLPPPSPPTAAFACFNWRSSCARNTKGKGVRMRASVATVTYGRAPAAGHQPATLECSNSVPDSTGVTIRAPARVLWMSARLLARLSLPLDDTERRQMRQYLYFCTGKCVSICTFVLVNASVFVLVYY